MFFPMRENNALDILPILAANRHTPSLRRPLIRLYAHIAPQTPTVPEGQARIPMRWGQLLLSVGALVALPLSGVMVVRAWRGSRRNRD